MRTRTGGYVALMLILVGLVSMLIAPPVRGNPLLQGTATEQAAPTAQAGSIDDLSVISVEPLDMLAGPVNTTALIAPDGTHFAYVTRDKVCIYTTAGQQENCIDVSQVRFAPNSMRWSPDSRKLALTEDLIKYLRDPDVWIIDTTSGKLTDITDDGVVDTVVIKPVNANIDLSPSWSSDSKSLTFVRYIQTGRETSAPTLFTIAAEGGISERIGELVSSNRLSTYILTLSPDGSKIAYNVDTNSTGNPLNGVWLADSDGKNPKQILSAEGGALPSTIEFSADGRYVLVTSNVSNATKPEQSPVRIALVDGSGDFLVDQGNLVRAAAWAPSGAGLAYLVYDVVHDDTSGLYLAAGPGKPGRLVLPGRFADRLLWGANNTILLSTPGGKPLNVVHLGHK